uniref:Uncharacterized protein n=1 Tax=Anguilla anguilla TaxID=7936 RepID=A0A0E9TAY6_ANGAN
MQRTSSISVLHNQKLKTHSCIHTIMYLLILLVVVTVTTS